MNLKEVLEHFEVKSGPNGESGYYECFCPAHKDTHPSLLIKAGDETDCTEDFFAKACRTSESEKAGRSGQARCGSGLHLHG